MDKVEFLQIKPQFSVYRGQLKQTRELQDKEPIKISIFSEWKAAKAIMILTTLIALPIFVFYFFSIFWSSEPAILKFVTSIVGYLGIMYVLRRARTLKKVYSADTQIAYCEANNHSGSSNDARYKTKVNKKRGATLAKVALAGVAGSTWKNGHGFISGASAGLAATIDDNPETKVVQVSPAGGVVRWTTIHIYFTDGEHLRAETSSGIGQFFPQFSLLESKDEISLLKKMELDANKVSKEVARDISKIEKNLERVIHESEEGDSFETRENAKEERLLLEATLRRKERLKEHLDSIIAKSDER